MCRFIYSRQIQKNYFEDVLHQIQEFCRSNWCSEYPSVLLYFKDSKKNYVIYKIYTHRMNHIHNTIHNDIVIVSFPSESMDKISCENFQWGQSS